MVAALCIMLTAKGADTDAHIYGHIIDGSTGEHLPHIVVILKGTTIGVSSDNTGHYIMRNLPEGKFILEVSAIGKKLGEYAFALAVNVTDEESVAKMVQETVEKWGGLDLFVSNAGVAKAGNLMDQGVLALIQCGQIRLGAQIDPGIFLLDVKKNKVL